MRLRLFQTTAFRWTLGSAAVLALSLTAMGGFFYWQTVGYLTRRTETALVLEARSLATEKRRIVVVRIDKALSVDPRGIKLYGLFLPSGERLAGDLDSLPHDLPPADHAADVTVMSSRPGRGAIVSLGTLRRVEGVRRACSLIMEGEFHRRLPVRRNRDEFDRLSEMVNLMLDEIERLVSEVRGAGDAIAHDLRTPLTRIRARLDRALDPDARHAPVPEVLQKSIADVDQLLSTVTAILRLAEVEQGRRESGFGPVDLDDVLEAVGELYAPIADEKEIHLETLRHPMEPIRGDRDLVFEAVANLVDNAIKFTPNGGRVGIELRSDRGGAVIRVWDTGPGIPPRETEAVMRRFHRLDPSRHLPGTGLGLSLVAAIARLHGFVLTVGTREGGGCEVAMRCPAPEPAGPERARASAPAPRLQLEDGA